MALIALLMIATAITVGTYLFLVPAASIVDTVPEGVSNLHEAVLRRSRSDRVLKPALKTFGSVVGKATPQGRINKLHGYAVSAGIQGFWTKRVIALMRLVSLLLGALTGVVFMREFGPLLGVVFLVLACGISFRLVDTYLINRARTRQDIITSSLPDYADQVAICVEAGLNLDQAIRRTALSNAGPISDEFQRFLRDIRVGMRRQDAYRALIDRVDLPDMSSFIRAVANGERHGVSIGEILVIQADELREKRRQRAEERAMRLPVLMLFPLSLCILPPLLAILIGPVLIELTRTGLG